MTLDLAYVIVRHMTDSGFCESCGQRLPEAELISSLEAARILGWVSSKTVTRLADEGAFGKVEFTEGGQRRFRRDLVEAFAAERASQRAAAAGA